MCVKMFNYEKNNFLQIYSIFNWAIFSGEEFVFF